MGLTNLLGNDTISIIFVMENEETKDDENYK